jgi:hypothetical protein
MKVIKRIDGRKGFFKKLNTKNIRNAGKVEIKNRRNI